MNSTTTSPAPPAGADMPVGTNASAPQARAAALRVSGVSLAFGCVAALRDVSLTVAPSEIRAVVGPNGAGKSSLLNVVTGLYRPQAGTVAFEGREFSGVPTAQLTELGVGRIFQNISLLGGLSVLDNVAAGCNFQACAGLLSRLIGTGRARAEARDALDRARQAIGFFDLDAHADKPAGTLPYGLQKRVELARAMVAHPRLLLLDEPMAGLVRADKEVLARAIRTLRDGYGTAVVLIEHHVGIVMDLSDRIMVLDHGRKIADGTSTEVASNQAVIDAYLRVPHDGKPADDKAPRAGRHGIGAA